MRKISFVLVFTVLFSFVCFYGCKKEEQITSYQIICEFNDNKIVGSEKVTFYNDSENSFSELKFNLFANAYREGAKYSPFNEKNKKESYPNGINYGNITIESVKCENENLVFKMDGIDENILTVSLIKELFPSESVEVEIAFTVILSDNISRMGINDKTINLGNFYPILCGIEDGKFYECVYYTNGDPFYSDVANYNVVLTLPSDYVVASSGKILSSNSSGDKITNEYSIEKARSFCMVLSKEFESVMDNSLGVEINYYYYKDTNPKKSLKVAVDSIKTFSELFGQYPYKTFSVVETPFNEGGMEYPALVYISSELEEKAYEEVIVHETAHQWWQTAVGNNEIKYGFLDEGLAEYSVVLFYEQNPSYNRSRQSLIKSCENTYRIYCSVFDKLYGNVDTSMMRSLGEYKSEYEYVNIAYIKGCLMQEYLRTGIGDEKYFSGLQKYFSDFCYKNATPYDFIGVYESLGCNTNGFFESFLNGNVIL